MDITSEGAHQLENDCPFPVVINLIYIIHQRSPLLERDLLVNRYVFVHELRYQFVLVRLPSGSGVYGREGREVVIHVIMSHYA